MKTFEKNHVPMSQKALLINSIHQKQKFKKRFEKIENLLDKKVEKSEIFMFFELQTNSTEYSPWR